MKKQNPQKKMKEKGMVPESENPANTPKVLEKKRSPKESVLLALEGQMLLDKANGEEGLDAYFDRGLGNSKIETAMTELQPKGEIVRGMGEALEKADNVGFLADTLQIPDTVSLWASKDRLELADKCGVLEMALDAGRSLKDASSIEKMLLHQMAACHQEAMRLLVQAKEKGMEGRQTNNLDGENKLADITSKLVNASTRLMNVYQAGAQTLVKLRTGGKQQVIVQHIHVNGDAQAVVAGKMDYPEKKGGPGGGGQDGK